MKVQANKHRKDVTYAVRNWVNLKLWYKPKSLAKKINEKLSPRFYGPYQITKVGVSGGATRSQGSSQSQQFSFNDLPDLSAVSRISP